MKRLTISLAKSPWKGLLLTGSILAILTACGDDSSKPHGVETPVREVSTIFELGPCNADRQGDTILVLDKASEYLCTNNDWIEIATPFENGSSSNVEGDRTLSSSSSLVDNKTTDTLVVKDASIMGAAHKGPFKFNSPITLYEAALRNDSLVLTGRNYIDEVSSNKGDFVIPKVSLVSPYAVLEVRGLWRNEISGEWSKDSMTLYALTDLSGRSEVNINLLTHLEIDRAQALIGKGYSVYAAKKQAQFEIMTAFGFATTVENAENLKTFVSSSDAAHDANATLMAISLLFIGERSEAEIQISINNFKKDLAEDGVWDDAQTKANMADWAESFDGGSVRANVKSWNILDIPNYENFLTVFWNNAYELGGCASTRLGVVAQNKNEKSRNYNVHYICKIAGWQKATDYEKDTYQWTNGKEGDVRKGNVTPTYYTFENGNWVVAKNENVLGLCDSKRTGELAKVDATYFICRNEKWNHATALEYDTYNFGVGKEGEVRVGKVNTDQYYVYENGAWRTATSTIEKDLGACVTSREGEIGKSSDTYYICKSRSWTTATALEYDTYGKICSDNGMIIDGAVTDNKYVCDADTFRYASKTEFLLNMGCVSYTENEKIIKEIRVGMDSIYTCKGGMWIGSADMYVVYGTILDRRDQQTYKTVVIGTQTWMAQNLNYYDNIIYPGMQERSWCYNNSSDSCRKYGRLYTWAVAMDSLGIFSVNAKNCGNGIICAPSYPVRGICPEGWHLPTSLEMDTLLDAVGGEFAAKMLKTTNGWKRNGNGVDAYGFSALPAGYWDNNAGEFRDNGSYAIFWSASDPMSNLDNGYSYGAYCMYLNDFSESGHINITGGLNYITGSLKLFGFSVRCIQDKEKPLNYSSSSSSVGLNSSSSQGANYAGPTFVDNRDNHIYKMVTIGTQTWMGENLNYETVNSFCLDNNTDKCSKYGRLYTWSAAMDSTGSFGLDGKGCGYGISCSPTYPVHGICPEGWHLPSKAEIETLFSSVGGMDYAGKALMSADGWNKGGKGIDSFSFSALPAGVRVPEGVYYNEGVSTGFWSSTAVGNSTAYSMGFVYSYVYAFLEPTELKSEAFSVRCIKD